MPPFSRSKTRGQDQGTISSLGLEQRDTGMTFPWPRRRGEDRAGHEAMGEPGPSSHRLSILPTPNDRKDKDARHRADRYIEEEYSNSGLTRRGAAPRARTHPWPARVQDIFKGYKRAEERPTPRHEHGYGQPTEAYGDDGAPTGTTRMSDGSRQHAGDAYPGAPRYPVSSYTPEIDYETSTEHDGRSGHIPTLMEQYQPQAKQGQNPNHLPVAELPDNSVNDSRHSQRDTEALVANRNTQKSYKERVVLQDNRDFPSDQEFDSPNEDSATEKPLPPCSSSRRPVYSSPERNMARVRTDVPAKQATLANAKDKIGPREAQERRDSSDSQGSAPRPPSIAASDLERGSEHKKAATDKKSHEKRDVIQLTEELESARLEIAKLQRRIAGDERGRKIEALELSLNSLQAEKEKIESELNQKVVDLGVRHKEQLLDKTTQHEQELRTIEETHKSFITAERNKLEAIHKANVDKLQSKHDRDQKAQLDSMGDLRELRAKDQETHKREKVEALDIAKSQLAQQEAELNRSHAGVVEELKSKQLEIEADLAKCRVLIKSFEQARAEELKRREQEWKDKWERLREEQEKKHSEKREQWKSTAEAHRKRYEQETQALSVKYNTLATKLERDSSAWQQEKAHVEEDRRKEEANWADAWTKKKDSLEAEHKALVDSWVQRERDWEFAEKNLIREHTEYVENLKCEHAERFEKLKREKSQLHTDWQKAWDKRQLEIDEDSQREQQRRKKEKERLAIEKLEAEKRWESKKTRLIDEHNCLVRDVEGRHTEQVLALEAELMTAVAGRDSEVARLGEDYQRRIRDREQELGEHHARELQKREAQFRELRVRHDGLGLEKDAELEILKRRYNNQYQDLQRRFLDSADGFQPTDDVTFKDMFELLGDKITSMMRCNLKVSTVDLGVLFRQQSFIRLVTTERDAKLVVEQAIWDTIYQKLLSTPFKVYGKYGDVLFASWRKLALMDETSSFTNDEMPPPDSRAEKWRCATIECLEAALNSEADINAMASMVQSSHHAQIAAVSDDLGAMLKKVIPSPDLANIQKVVQLASEMARKLSLQRCRMQLFSFEAGRPVADPTPNVVNDRNGKNEGKNTTGTVLLSISPGLRRLGDARGGSLNKETTLIQAAGVFLKRMP